MGKIEVLEYIDIRGKQCLPLFFYANKPGNSFFEKTIHHNKYIRPLIFSESLIERGCQWKLLRFV
jgi:hypothetical protein